MEKKRNFASALTNTANEIMKGKQTKAVEGSSFSDERRSYREPDDRRFVQPVGEWKRPNTRIKSKVLSVDIHESRVDRGEFGQIFTVGLTAALTNIASSVCVVFMNQYLLPYGDEKIAALGIVLRVTMIVQLILVGFSFGGVPLFGFLYGEAAALLHPVPLRSGACGITDCFPGRGADAAYFH